ncbi:MAG: tol-pal system protein YbgF [Acidobacteria bacterium]|nr:tol-pal system protein YbgF [Acidobacteriota bacterium]
MKFKSTVNIIRWVLAAFLLPAMFLACAPRKSGNLSTEIEDLQNRLYELQKRNAEAQVEIQELQEGSPGGSSPTSPASGSTAADPSGSLTEEPLVPGSTVDLGDQGPTRSAEVSPAVANSKAPTPNQSSSPSSEADKLYVDGYAQFNSGNYQVAQQDFSEFLARSPESDLADDAQYWIGECYFSQKDYRRAILEFRKVIDQYPFGNRVPHAFLKVGLCYLALGDRDRASESLETVVQAFPRSEVATVAKATLDEINKTSPR